MRAFTAENQLSLLLERRLDTEKQSQKFLLLNWTRLLSSQWADYCELQARPALSQRGSDLVELPVENCLQHTLLFAFIVHSSKSYRQLCASQTGGFSFSL